MNLALIVAAGNGHSQALAILLRHRSYGTETKEALIAAAGNGHSQALNTLLRSRSYGKPAIKQAYRASAISGQRAFIRILQAFLNLEDATRLVNEFDDAGRTPLHWAIERNDKSTVLVLLQHGASVAFLDNHGLSPLMLAAQNQRSCSRGLAHAVAAVPVTASAPEMQMGVGFRGDVQATALLHTKTFLGIERQPGEAHIQLYGTMVQAILESLESPDIFEITSNPAYGSKINTWGECLFDSHVRFLLGPNLSVTLRLDRILGFGSGALGCDIIRMVRATEDSIGSRGRYFRLQKLLHASPSSKPEILLSLKLLAWLYALIHSVCDQEIRRIGRFGSVAQDLPEFGQCWKEAFGDPMLVDLRSVGTTKEIFNLGCSLDANVGMLLQAATFTTMLDLRLALNIDSEATLDNTKLMRGPGGVCVLVGNFPGCDLPLWHVCSIEEACMINADPPRFLKTVESMRDHLAQTCPPNTWMMPPFSGDVVLVGALIQPYVRDNICCQGLFQAPKPVVAGRSHLHLERAGLQWEAVFGEVQLSMGAQGPQASLSSTVLGAGLSNF
ncbi:unnamed protein product [Fusarium langsethiae]|nr:unnamed protein product [Fusarium langsethiae]